MSDPTHPLEKYQYENLVILKRRTASAIFAEEIYSSAFDYPQHDHELANFMLTPNCVYREKLGGKTFYHPPNSILWRPAEISHADSIKENNDRSFSVYIKPGLLGKFSEYSKIPISFSEKNTFLVFLAAQLRSEFGNWLHGSELIVEGLLLEMLGHAARKGIPADKNPPRWILRVVEKLEDEFLESHTNQELAGEAGVHPVHLARTFRKYYGKSIGRFLKEKRVHCAKLLIMQEHTSLADIACASGFADQSQLTRAFKEIVKITPGAFRREIGSK